MNKVGKLYIEHSCISSSLTASSESKAKQEFFLEEDGLELFYYYSQDENLTLQLHLKNTVSFCVDANRIASTAKYSTSF